MVVAAPNAPAKPTAKSLVKPMGFVPNPSQATELLPVVDEEKSRFVIELYDGDCEILYEIDGDTITLLSIDIPETARGQGIGKKLARFAFNYAADQKLYVVVKCSFLAAYYMENRTNKKYRKLRVIGRYTQETLDKEY